MLKMLATAAVMAIAAGGASAATLSIDGGTTLALGADFDPTPMVAGLGEGTSFQNFTQSNVAGQGLRVDGPVTVTVTFLGKEALFTNTASSALSNGGSVSTTDEVGASFSFSQLAGLVNFTFLTDGGSGPDQSIVNGVGATAGTLDLGLTFGSDLTPGGSSIYALFGDGGNNDDDDFDDMVVRIDVAAIPVPAAGILLVSALGGLALMRRRKSA